MTNTMELYEEIIQYYPFFFALITAGCLFRMIYCFVRMIGADETELPLYKRRIKNSIVFFIISFSVLSLAGIVMGYANP